jgi:hypothetical protein
MRGPREALDQLILGWEGNDMPLVEDALSRETRAAFNSEVKLKQWSRFRRAIWEKESNRSYSVGYRLKTSGGGWVEPVMAKNHQPVDYIERPRPKIEIVFTTASGKECGVRPVGFLKSEVTHRPPRYLVDESDVVGLLRLISHCAATQ